MKEFWPLLAFKVRCRLKSEARTSYLNYGWWVAEPLLYMGIFYLVFGVLMNRGTDNFVAYLLCGLIPWLWFSKSVSNSMGSVVAGRGIMMQARVPIALFPAEVVVQDAVKQLIVFTLLLLFLLAYGMPPTVHWLAVGIMAVVQLAFTLSIAFTAAALVPFLPDARYLISTGLLMVMFASGIFYQIELILPEHRALFFLNPMATLIQNYRKILLYQEWPNWHALAWILLFSVSVLALINWQYRKNRSAFVRVVLES